MDKDEFKRLFLERFLAKYGRPLAQGTLQEAYQTLAGLVREEISKKWAVANNLYTYGGQKQVYYFSIEFLPGRLLTNNLVNLGLSETVREGLAELGLQLEELKDQEEDPGLGNGGLGRLAAAFLDSLAALEYPGHGCGIRYQYGLFEQQIRQGHQVELPDNWLINGYPWEYRREEESEEVRLGGTVKIIYQKGRLSFIQEGYEKVRAVPYDVPMVGYRNNTVNTLRLWKAESATVNFDFCLFSRGEYLKAFADKIKAETISQVLYPDDSSEEGRRLRLKQEYFLVSAGLQSIIRRYKKGGGKIADFPEQVAVHINDTHPSLAIPELMRILLDEEGLGWDRAWGLTNRTVSFTNHTILPEALEKWPVHLLKEMLPRIYMIIEEINTRFCSQLLNRYPGNVERVRNMAIIADGLVKMGNLAVVGSHSVNGVAQLHTEILKNRVMSSLHEMYPGRFNNKTNGITQRRWLTLANPRLAEVISTAIGPGWLTAPGELKKLEALAHDASFQEQIKGVKKHNKEQLASFIRKKYGLEVDTDSIFDIQIKRIHGYKRQLLNVLHIMDMYNRLLENPAASLYPRTFIFGGKAAPAYYLAKKVIKLINTLAERINNDRSIGGRIKVVFLENYNVSLAELTMPAADVSEQISTASKEASGTGNMKFIMNGAVTIGTLDGANIEIIKEVGAQNFFSFGLTAEEVLTFYHEGGYRSWDVYREEARLRQVCEQLINGFLPNSGDEFAPLYDHLLPHNDEFFVLKDFSSYVEAHDRLESSYRDREKWLQMGIYNIANSGFFSSDRTIRQYAEEIWQLKPMPVTPSRVDPDNQKRYKEYKEKALARKM